MRPHSVRNKQSANALIVTLGLTCVLMVGLGSSMLIVKNQFRSTMRSQQWNASIPITEAGIEEAMAHLNRNCLVTALNPTIYQPDSHGWSYAGGMSMVEKSRTFPDGSYYNVSIDISNTNSPEIFSKGYAPKPFAAVATKSLFATIGSETESDFNQHLNRNVRVRTRLQPLFRHALAADGSIDLSGNNVETDSFNSRTNTMSTNGRYDRAKRNARGDVASNTNLVGAVSVGNANILGHVSVGPGGSITIGNNGTIGDRDWVDNGTTGVQPGHTNSDMNVYFPEVQKPFENGLSPLRGVTIPTITSYTTNETLLGSCECSSYATLPCCVPPGTNGIVLRVTALRTAESLPAANSYVGVIVTNWTLQQSQAYPSSSNVRNIYTNTTTAITEPYQYPSSGTYMGKVTTNVVQRKNQKTKPAEGMYVPGTLTKNGNNWTYNVLTYSYQQITGYRYETIGSYSYSQITGFKRVLQTIITNFENVTYNYVFDGGKYVVSELSGNVLVRGHAQVYCSGSVSITGQEAIRIEPNASLWLYVAGASATIAGKGVINQAGYAADFGYYGLPSNKSVSITGNGQFTGTIYAPQAHLQLGGGGSNKEDFVGAAIVGSARLNGHFNFHYDESLETIGPARGYVISSWREE